MIKDYFNNGNLSKCELLAILGLLVTALFLTFILECHQTYVHRHAYKVTSTLISIYPNVTSLLETLIDVKPVCQFAAITGASVCHHDNISSLAADYDPFLDMH